MLTPVEEAQLRDLIAQQSALLSLAGVEATILSKLGATKVTLSDLPTASVIDDADLLLLRQGVTDKSVTGLTFKNLIPTTPDASEIVKGIIELATNAEVLAGTDTTRAVVPSSLLAFLGAGEAAAGGYLAIPYKDASDGSRKNIIMQWGVLPTLPDDSVSTAVTFPITFPTASLSIVTTADTYTPGATTFYVVSKSTATFNVRHSGSVAGSNSAGYYIAIGN